MPKNEALKINSLPTKYPKYSYLASGTFEGQVIGIHANSGLPITKPITFMAPYKKAKIYNAGGDVKKDWYVWYEYQHPDTGEWKRFIRKGGINKVKDKRERLLAANVVRDAVNKLLQSGWTPFSRSKTTNEFEGRTLIECLELLKQFRTNLRPRTIQSYQDTTRLITEWMTHAKLTYLYPSMVTRKHAMSFGDYMLTVKKYSGKTFNNHKNIVGGFYRELIDREVATVNPFAVLKKQKENTQRHLSYTDSERKRLKAYFEKNNPRLGLFCQFMYYLGIRPLELLQVQIRDVFPDRIMIYTGAAKNRRQEPVYMSDGCKKLVEQMELNKYNPTDYLFGLVLETCDRPYSRNRVSIMHRKIILALGLNRYHDLYSWKHTGAEAFYKAHKDPLRLMKHLRHTDMQSTLKYIRALGLDYENVGIADF